MTINYTVTSTNYTDIFVAAGLPIPEREYRFHRRRRWRWDYAWPNRLIALEIQGGVWTKGRHTRGKGYIADLEKLNEGQLLGWTVLWVTPEQMADGTALRLVERALIRASMG